MFSIFCRGILRNSANHPRRRRTQSVTLWRDHEIQPDMTYRARLSERLLPIALALAGFCTTGLSIILLLNAAKLGIFMRMMLGFIGVIFVDSVILTLVAVRIAVSKEDHATLGEKVVLLGLSLCTGIGLMIT